MAPGLTRHTEGAVDAFFESMSSPPRTDDRADWISPREARDMQDRAATEARTAERARCVMIATAVADAGHAAATATAIIASGVSPDAATDLVAALPKPVAASEHGPNPYAALLESLVTPPIATTGIAPGGGLPDAKEQRKAELMARGATFSRAKYGRARGDSRH